MNIWSLSGTNLWISIDIYIFQNVNSINTFIGASKPFRIPRRNLVINAMKKFVLRPNNVLRITLIRICGRYYFLNQISYGRIKNLSSCHTYTENSENTMTSFLPYRSATKPQKIEERVLPIMYAFHVWSVHC